MKPTHQVSLILLNHWECLDAVGEIVSPSNQDLTETQVVILDDGIEDPLSYKHAMNDLDKNQWVKAMNLEMESMYFN